MWVRKVKSEYSEVNGMGGLLNSSSALVTGVFIPQAGALHASHAKNMLFLFRAVSPKLVSGRSTVTR